MEQHTVPRVVDTKGANTLAYFVPSKFFQTSLTVRLDCRATNGVGTRKYQTILSQG